LGWYAIVRAMRPEHVIETGTDKGLGAVVLAAALLRNGTGRLTTIDLNPEAGYLVSGQWATVTAHITGDTVEVLERLTRPVDMFIHDSLHTVAHEALEYALVEPHLAPGALVLSDNAHNHPTLMEWAEGRGWTYEFFHEATADHWYEGDGIGVAHQLMRPA
jgi:predicted O-methyltransferase YrrM